MFVAWTTVGSRAEAEKTSGTATSVAWKYLFPGVAGMLVFVAFPLLYTVQIGFTNYSSANLLDYERARDYLLAQTTVDEAHAYDVSVHAAEGGGHRQPEHQADDHRRQDRKSVV